MPINYYQNEREDKSTFIIINNDLAWIYVLKKDNQKELIIIKNNNKKGDKVIINTNIVMSILLVVVLSFVSVGYAYYSQRLTINGSVTIKPQGKIAITNVVFTSGTNVKDDINPTFTDNSIDFDLAFEKDEGSQTNTYQAIYNVTSDGDTISLFAPVMA